MSARVAFLGLGVMGGPMAGHLVRAGHDVVVYNRTEAKAAAWLERHAGRAATTPGAAAAGRDFVFVCVGNDDDLRSIMYGPDGVLAAVADDAVVVDHTTTSADVAREVYERAAAAGAAFIDAPVSGGEAGAVNGSLTVMAGGDIDALARAKPVIAAYAKAVTRIGPAGAGQLAKMVNQICIAGVLQGLAEGLDFALRAGLDPAAVIDAIGNGAAQSWQMDNRWRTMVDGKFDFGFAVDWMRKDLGFAIDEGRRNGALLELAGLVDAYYAEVQAMGGARWDTSSLIARLRRM
ncbi:MAG TPA: NAD(P)-dependent oxidoreductase [Woeseiaceae bacterium]|nr:NAD(P)-dependent oxidoreductase [Woeseiaceae bacterium]